VGLVDIADRPYDEVVGAFQCTNPALTGVHAAAGRAPRPDGDTQMVTIVRAAHAVDLTDASLTDWDKASTLLRGFAAEPPYVPFADVYLAWAPAGLYLATIGMDYMHPDHLAYEGRFPLSESYQLHLLVFLQGRTHHCAVHWVPEEVTFASSDSTNARGSITLVPSLCAYTPEGTRGALPGAVVQHLRAAAPRISCEAYFPAAIFGRPRFEGGLSLRMNIVLRSHYGVQEMFWAAGTQAGTFTRPEGWRPVRLGSTGAGATWRIGRRSERERLCSV